MDTYWHNYIGATHRSARSWTCLSLLMERSSVRILSGKYLSERQGLPKITARLRDLFLYYSAHINALTAVKVRDIARHNRRNIAL